MKMLTDWNQEVRTSSFKPMEVAVSEVFRTHILPEIEKGASKETIDLMTDALMYHLMSEVETQLLVNKRELLHGKGFCRYSLSKTEAQQKNKGDA